MSVRVRKYSAHAGPGKRVTRYDVISTVYGKTTVKTKTEATAKASSLRAKEKALTAAKRKKS